MPGDATDFMMAGILGLTQEANQNVTAVINNYVKSSCIKS